MSQIMVTGGAGFIGGHIVRNLVTKHDVKIYDIKTGQDIRDKCLLDKELKGVDYVLHLAALVSVAESMKEPEKYFCVNVKGTNNVLEAAERNGVEKLVFASSAAIYGDVKPPVTENKKKKPKSVYAISKLIGENLISAYSDTTKPKGTSLRMFNVYGPGQDPNSPYAAAIPIFINRAIRNQDITIYGDGNQIRDFIYVGDVVSAFEAASKGGNGKAFNIASGKGVNINELAEMIVNLTNSQSKIVHNTPRTGEIRDSLANIERAKKILDWTPKYDMERGLKKTIEWYESIK